MGTTYTAEYTYDSQGRLKTLLAGAGTTTWNYDSQRGFLTSKVYDDDQGTSYTYTDAGRLLTRGWARGITTTYAYNNAGDLASVNYSDSTPDVSHAYDRLGRASAVTDGAGSHAMTYNAIGRLLTETHTGGPLDGVAVNRTYSLNRLATLGSTKGTNTLTSVSYGYDDASRLSTVTDGTRTATYAYLTNSNLAAALTFKRSGSTVFSVSKSYDNLNRLTQIGNTPTNDTARSCAYTYNSANQRTRMDLADGSYWLYGYDSLGQVTSGKKYFSDNATVSGHQFGYAFDSIGNRTATTNGTRQASYTANSLNQYTQRTISAAFDVFGAAKTNATVTVNNAATARKGEFFYKEIGVTNSSAAAYAVVNIVGVKNSVGGNGEDAVTQKTGNVYVPKTPEVFTYDDDGNLLSDGRWNYTWDGENRLTKMESISSVPAAAKKKLEFAYDYQGRRVSKKVYDWNGSSYTLSATRSTLFDGWNKIAELDGSASLTGSFTWGNDLSGSFQGAGGVGGLLFATHNSVSGSPSYAVGYDGNGNVTALADTNSGAWSAEYEYSPFGETLRASGPAADLNACRFSSKYEDLETGLLYYGYRYLNPGTGRWLSRDPSEEQGGINLFGIGQNDFVNYVDSFGLISKFSGCCDCEEKALKRDEQAAIQYIRYLKARIATAIAQPNKLWPEDTVDRLESSSNQLDSAEKKLKTATVICEDNDSDAIAKSFPYGNEIKVFKNYWYRPNWVQAATLIHEGTHMGSGTTDLAYFWQNQLPIPPTVDAAGLFPVGFQDIASTYDSWIINGFCIPGFDCRAAPPPGKRKERECKK